VLYFAARPRISRRTGLLVAAANGLMTLDGVITLAGGRYPLTAFGVLGVVLFGLYTAGIGAVQACAALRAR
jgi:hypothetical protein